MPNNSTFNKNWAEQFEMLANKIDKHPLLEVKNFKFFSPISENIVEKVKLTFGSFRLDPILQFYQECNGLQLVWGAVDGVPAEELEITLGRPYHIFERVEYFDQDYESVIGSINILPLEETLFSEGWNDFLFYENDFKTFEFRGIDYTYHEFGLKLKLFDLFSEESGMSFLFLENEIVVLLLSDNFGDWHSTRLTSFENYITLLFQTGGVIEIRELIYSKLGGHKLPYLYLKDEELSSWKLKFLT